MKKKTKLTNIMQIILVLNHLIKKEREKEEEFTRIQIEHAKNHKIGKGDVECGETNRKKECRNIKRQTAKRTMTLERMNERTNLD